MMFKNKRAWFSQSVSRRVCDLWVAEGGMITNLFTADYIFSEDACNPDTQRIYQSLDYVENRITVFHASYLSACEKSKNNRAVSVGHFVLPPAHVQKDIKAEFGCFIWEKEDCLTTKEVPCDRLTLVKGKKNKDLRKQQICGLKTSERGMTCCNLQQYPVNNMVTGYVFIDEMKKYSGELHDFTPGDAGYSVYRAHCEKYILPSGKNRRDRIHTN
ncbi:telomere repeats-binding bouquet formation protein 2 isoform X1 [Acipenser ruthenus]|uniref:telomere repeats-binding bouquet formation protein 2 isoform X1 n=2 Tax=Acipenser ruthenus TaxID=7906 RepID=UPI0027414425|nr:telomere repeats-binding bouquet formation protein 2 isoform X1 [Acipenser ruthenus]XP_058854814.1 telomere repeats-binding bouquet formation protein 2 isoform X1 [Acipenser ruthenus]XP_058854816.1 telomere repeats-binding bouquet formation protein 2 isoform X1 [Acipenser ruthenus]